MTDLFEQAKSEIAHSLKPVFEENPKYKDIFENICEPERVLRWKAVWDDDNGQTHINTCWRVQQNSALGPYKGGLRFDSSVKLETLRFLALEQVLKNALTGKPLGGGKGGSDFNPKGKSDRELRRFCRAFMTGLYTDIGPDTDVPAGDIGVNSKTIGYLYGTWRSLRGVHSGVLSGKGLDWGGSNARTEATGYGVVYMAEEWLKFDNGGTVKDKHILVSGAGNVATYAVRKCIELGAVVHSMSDRKGTYFVESGFTNELVDSVLTWKASGGRGELASEISVHEGKRPWQVRCDVDIDIALPCATQNEVEMDDAVSLAKRKCAYLLEGSNMSSTIGAIKVYNSDGIKYCGGKLSNLGGVATSFLEMEQNAQKNHWEFDVVDAKLRHIMANAFKNAMTTAQKYNVSLTDGANISGFLKVAKVMVELGYATL